MHFSGLACCPATLLYICIPTAPDTTLACAPALAGVTGIGHCRQSWDRSKSYQKKLSSAVHISARELPCNYRYATTHYESNFFFKKS